MRSPPEVRFTVLLFALLAGCLRDAPLPDVGPCADYPDGVYAYGDIGIGSCLSGPTSLRFVEGTDGQDVLLVTNSNPYLLFTGGSLMAIPYDQIDLSTGRNTITDLDTSTLDLPSFAGGMDTQGDLGLVAVRLSEDELVRQTYDEVHLVDLTDPLALAPSDRGDDGGATVQVQSDPNDVVVDSTSGLAFVSNRTSHSISVLDVSGEQVEIVLPWPTQVTTAAVFDDADASGSTAELADFTVDDDSLLPDDYWTLSWIDGTWRLWVPALTGAFRSTTTGDGVYTDSAMGIELDISDTDELLSVDDPFYMPSQDRMYFADQGSIRAADSGSYLGSWAFQTATLLDGREGEWDAAVGGPALVDSDDGLYLFYDGDDGTTQAIGAALSGDGVTFSRFGEPLLQPTWDHEAAGISDPHVVYDTETSQWQMYYSAYDGERWTIGHATSPDLTTWTSDEQPVFALDQADAAAPVVSAEVGAWRMWYAQRADDGAWRIAAAQSPDGVHWTDLGVVLDTDAYIAYDEQPPGVALEAAPMSAFRVAGENADSLLQPVTPGVDFSATQYGWSTRALAGAWLTVGDAGPDSDGGIQVDSVTGDTAWLTLTSAGGTPRIGRATIEEGGALVADEGAIFEGTDGFDRDGVFSPVVVEDGDGWRMYYAGQRGDEVGIGLATSTDGSTWTRVGEVLSPGADWDSIQVVPGAIEQTDEGERLWYSGSDGSTWRIGAASTTDGQSFTRETGTHDWLLGTGSLADWDDSGVRDPWVVSGEDAEGNPGLHIWYSGFDGDTWRGGYAWRDQDGVITRTKSDSTDEPRFVIGNGGGLFHTDGVLRPVMIEQADASWSGWYAGLDQGTARTGHVQGPLPERLHKTPLRPTPGDTLQFSTERGDESVEAIPLDQDLESQTTTGVGLTSLALDEDRGMLYAASKLTSYLYVIDVRDDSDESTGFQDLNYLDLEAILPLTTSSGAVGWRQVVPIPGSDRVLALNDAPEAITVLDTSGLVDDEFADVVYDSLVGWLPAARGYERDQGVRTQASVGPAQVAIHPDGRRLFLTNYNANSIGVYDLSLGPYGQLVAEVPLVGENPYSIAIAPDGLTAVFANYVGEVDENGLSESTLGVLDIDESSPTYLEVLTWVANR